MMNLTFTVTTAGLCIALSAVAAGAATIDLGWQGGRSHDARFVVPLDFDTVGILAAGIAAPDGGIHRAGVEPSILAFHANDFPSLALLRGDDSARFMPVGV